MTVPPSRCPGPLARVVMVVVGALILVACRPVPPDATTGGTGLRGSYRALRGPVVGAGSSLQAPFQEVAIDQLSSLAPDLDVNYQASGSGRGKQELADQLVDFAGTESAVRPEDTGKFKGGALLTIPVVGAPIAVTYNLEGVEFLQLRPETLAQIFQRDITRWDDPRIAADNPGTAFPARPILLARRADSSGTTNAFTAYLALAAGSAWRLGSGDTITWPDDTQASVGNAGVSQVVKTTPGSIGYADAADANATSLLTVAIRNRNGEFVRPTVDGASRALEASTVSDDLLVHALDAPGAGVYPITTVTYLLTYAEQRDAAKADALKGYLGFLLSDGQALAASATMTPLPEPLRQRAVAALAQVRVRT